MKVKVRHGRKKKMEGNENKCKTRKKENGNEKKE